MSGEASSPYSVELDKGGGCGMAVTTGCCGGSGGEWECSQLGGCSITDLGDVDTQTDPPSEGDTLVWDGDQWVAGPPAQTTVSTGCGLSGEGTEDEPLTVAVSGESDFGCPSTEGEPIYCDSEGQLRAGPERFQAAFQETITLDDGELTDFAPVGEMTDLDSLSGTFTNPSDCLP